MSGFAIVGCGMIAGFHLRALAEIPDARVVALMDQVPGAAQRLSESSKLHCDAYTELRPMLDRKDVDVVIVCTPSGAHMDSAVAAAEAGKHVVVEKPLESTTERCDRIINACAKNGVQLCTIFPSRFADSNRTLKAAIDAGRFGRLTLGETTCKWWRSQEYYDKGGWRGTWKLDGGGALMNQGIHGIDLLQWLMGGVQEVTAFTATLAHERIEVEDTAVASVRFANGALGSIEGTTGSWPGSKIRLEIGGTKGNVVMEDDTFVTWRFHDEGPADEQIRTKYGPQENKAGAGAGDPRAISFEGHRLQFEDFVRAIRTGSRPYCNGEDARAAVAAITSIYQSATTGRPVAIS
jgi:UDP-N-acetyl-2-amino-2-deoxyglucuronate dehydrogenase